MRLLSVLSASVIAAAAVLAPASAALAQAEYPSRSVRMIVPFAPGGISDVLGRLIAQRLGSSLGSRWWSTTVRARARSSAPAS
jgi:tripartite-type tricarboxylate transporter receptor subunit TctC